MWAATSATTVTYSTEACPRCDIPPAWAVACHGSRPGRQEKRGDRHSTAQGPLNRPGPPAQASARLRTAVAVAQPVPDLSQRAQALDTSTTQTTEPTTPSTAAMMAIVCTSIIHVVPASLTCTYLRAWPMATWDVRRFRPNLVLGGGKTDGFVDGGLIDRHLRGPSGLELTVVLPTPRCVDSPAYECPCQRFADALTDARA